MVKYHLLTRILAELLAHDRTLEEMTDLLKCDVLMFQTLEDLKAACVEAADGKSQVRDFEVGVFCGHYKSEVPADYFERTARLHGNKKRKIAAVGGEEEERDAGAFAVAGSGVVNVPAAKPVAYTNGHAPDFAEDIRYVARAFSSSASVL